MERKGRHEGRHMELAGAVLEPERRMELPVAHRMEVVDYVEVHHTAPEVVAGMDYGMVLRMVAAPGEGILDSAVVDILAEEGKLDYAVAGADNLAAVEEDMLDSAAEIGLEAGNPAAGRTLGVLTVRHNPAVAGSLVGDTGLAAVLL